MLEKNMDAESIKMADLFDGTQRMENENDLEFELRRMALSLERGNEKSKRSTISKRLLELFNGRQDMVDEMIKDHPALLNGIDMLSWLQHFYTNALNANSKLERRNAILIAELLAYINWIETYRHKNERMPNKEWTKLRQKLAHFVDSIRELNKSDGGNISLVEFEANGHLKLLERVKAKIERLDDVEYDKRR